MPYHLMLGMPAAKGGNYQLLVSATWHISSQSSQPRLTTPILEQNMPGAMTTKHSGPCRGKAVAGAYFLPAGFCRALIRTAAVGASSSRIPVGHTMGHSCSVDGRIRRDSHREERSGVLTSLMPTSSPVWMCVPTHISPL